jgi:molybdenum cofactor cytidylyltransferase
MDNVMESPKPPKPARGLLLLAAGESSRMGRPKQLLEVGGKPLIVRAVEAALASAAWPVIVVLGAHASSIRPVLASFPVLLVENADWTSGMASSLRRGIATLQEFSRSIDGALVALCDQPHFSSATIAALWTAFRSPDCIVAARYGGTVGVPALFGRAYFPELLALEGAQGARSVLQKHAAKVTPVDLPELAIDLDTPEDVERYFADGG